MINHPLPIEIFIVDLEGHLDSDLAEGFFITLASAEPTSLDLAGIVTDEAVEAGVSASRAVMKGKVLSTGSRTRATSLTFTINF